MGQPLGVLLYCRRDIWNSYTVTKSRGINPRRSHESIQEMRRMYEAGEPVLEIAKCFNLKNTKTVLYHLKRHNVPRRQAGVAGSPENLTGRVFGRLTAEALTTRRAGQTRWRCRCSCGAITIVNAGALKNGSQVSCKCFRNEQARTRRLTHGMSSSPEHRSWSAAKTRCFN